MKLEQQDLQMLKSLHDSPTGRQLLSYLERKRVDLMLAADKTNIEEKSGANKELKELIDRIKSQNEKAEEQKPYEFV